jgi:16S rRNA (cytosine967-C5)-methyltransferase
MSRVSPARKAAFSILLRLEQGKGHSDELLRSQEVSALSPADRNLTTALVLGVLRWQVALDQQIQEHLKKPNAKLDTEVRIALRLGAFQIFHLDRIPARAAIDESVELAKVAGHRFASGMVNAVLRKLAAAGAEAKAASTETSAYPAWMVSRWTEQFGDETACVICRAGQHPAPLALRLIDPNAASELNCAGVQLEPGELLSQTRIVLTGDVTATAAFQEGRIRVQDEGSQLIAEIAGRGSTILDCCAAPGGKTMILAERNPSATIVACEASEPRLRAMRERVQSFVGRTELRHADATQLQYESQFDLVLADVPCSGTGTLGRNPEIRHRLRSEEFARQSERQLEILARAIQAAKPGGRIVYSTCSLEREEDEDVIAAVLAQNEFVRVVPLAERLGAMESEQILLSGAAERLASSLTPGGYLRLFPGQFGTDGFFVAVLERIR